MMRREFAEIESRFMAKISERFSLSGLDHPEIKRADLILLATERRDLMPMELMDWPVLDGIEALRMRIQPMTPEAAAKAFLDCFFHLQQQHRNMANISLSRRFLNGLLPNQWLAA
jgi:hypothetical protein